MITIQPHHNSGIKQVHKEYVLRREYSLYSLSLLATSPFSKHKYITHSPKAASYYVPSKVTTPKQRNLAQDASGSWTFLSGRIFFK